MIESIDDLLKQYELGNMTRRELLAALALLFVTPTRSPAQDGLFKARSFNHLNVRVTDVARSESFYRKVLGLPAIRPVVGDAFALDFPAGGFISLCPLSVPTCGLKPDGRPGDIDHFGVGIEGFEAGRVVSQLKAAGFAQVRSAGTSVLVTDPDGTIIQLSAATETYDVPRPA
jgi:catechol 2,3-dioxygenase-like lactoylglutathione lyase family enzyme